MKREFYVYQEDLIEYNANDSSVTMTEFVQRLNDTFCLEDMKKLRVEKIIEYLIAEKYLERKNNNEKMPTIKGKLMGIREEIRVGKDGTEYNVIVYDKRGQSYILDKLYSII